MEHVLALSRLCLALMSLAAWAFRLGDTAGHYRLGLCLLLGYVAASSALLLWLQIRRQPGRNFARWAQANDVGWPALLCLSVETPHSVYFILFLFAIMAAAFRWGFIETLATAVISAGTLLFQAVVVAHQWAIFPNGSFIRINPSALLMRCGFLLIAGTLLGCLAQVQKELSSEISVTNELLSLARVGGRFPLVLQNVLTGLARIFRGAAVYEVVAQSSSGRAFKWEIPSLSESAIKLREIAPCDKRCDLMTAYPHTFFMRRNGSNGSCSVIALDEEGRRLDSDQVKDLEMPVANADSLLVVSHEMGRDWSGRFVLLNPKLRRRERELRFAQNILRQVAPALYSVYLFRAFRTRAEATERARIARELHDGAIQSLVSIEMQVDVLRRRSADGDMSAELGRIQGLLRREVLNVRELMQSVRPIDIGPHQFLDFIAGLVERFSRDTGIPVRFVSELQQVTLPAPTCREMARVVQESLANIRRHSGARSAMVRLAPQNGHLKLLINDDGQGFPFAGRFTLSELDSSRRGPAVIKERVRAVGGDMVIESTPGQGSRLEITIPQKGYESYG